MGCPRCKSTDVVMLDYMGSKMLKCRSCGFDERDMHDVFAEEKVSQKKKKEYNPYKTGGYFRTL